MSLGGPSEWRHHVPQIARSFTSSSPLQVKLAAAATQVTTDGLLFGKGEAGSWDEAGVGSPVVSQGLHGGGTRLHNIDAAAAAAAASSMHACIFINACAVP